MRTGTLRHRVTLQEFVEIVDEYGTPIGEGWEDIATVWAAVEPITGREYIELHNTQSELSHKVTMRYRPGVTPANRLLFNGRQFDIQSVLNLEERNRELVLMCKEKVGG